MSTLSVSPPFPLITDIDGQPLEDGYIWIGTANLPPIGNPITVYWDAALTIPAALPIRTRGGYPVNAGTPARLYVNSDYSILVQNKNGSTLYSAPDGASDRFSAAQITYLPAGLGAVATTVQAKLRETVSVKDFGAVGDGVADDTAAIQAAADYCETNGAFLQGAPGTYLTSGTIAFSCSGDLSEMFIAVNGTTVTPAIRVGKHIGSGFTQKINLKLPQVNNTGHVAGDGWSGYDSNVGMSIDNLFDSVVYVPSVTGFGIGLYVGGVAFGNSYNQYTTGYIADNKVNLKIGPKTVSGWSNANTYYISRCRHNSLETNGGVPFAGTRNIFLDQCNDNLLLKPSIEGSSTVTEFTLELFNASFNTLINPRWEDSSTGGLSTMKIRMEGVLPKATQGNLILGGYELSTLVYTIVGNCPNNTKLGTSRGDQSFYLAQPIGISNNVGNGLSRPHLQGFDAAINPLGTSDSATNYNYRLHSIGFDGKRSTDDNPRIRLNWSAAGIQFGPGGATPIDKGIFMLGSSTIGTNSDWVPTVTNTYDLGISTLRWQDCFLVNAPNVSSDANTKQQVRELSTAERAVAVKCKGLIRAYKLNSAVEQKGDAARTHFGAIAQEVKTAFESEGLDPFEYGLLCYDEWEAISEQLDDDGKVMRPETPAGRLYSIRYEELLAFIIAAL